MTQIVEAMEDEPTDEQRASVSKLAREQLALEAEVEALEDRLKQAKAKLSEVRDVELPRAMLVIGQTVLTLTGGYKVELKDHYRCGQLDDAPGDPEKGGRPLSERLEALAWLDDNGHGDIARRAVTITLGARSEAVAREIIDLVRSHPAANSLLVDQRRLVPWNTLSKFAREQLLGGYDPPLELLGVDHRASVKITRPEHKEEF